MMGPPKYPESKIPTWEEFDADYAGHYFTGSDPMKGRCFIILYNNIDIGQINYNAISQQSKTTSMDIWLSDKKWIGQGIGPKAISILCEYLHKNFACKRVEMAPSQRNTNAIKAYEKAGFVLTSINLDESEKDYPDNVVMVKTLQTDK